MTKKKDSIMIAGTEVPISYTKGGKVDKKTRDAIAEAKGFKIAQNMTSQFDSSDVINLMTFLGLSVAYKEGVIDYMPQILNKLGEVAEAVGEAAEEAARELREAIDDSKRYFEDRGVNNDIVTSTFALTIPFIGTLGEIRVRLPSEAKQEAALINNATNKIQNKRIKEAYDKWQSAQGEVKKWLRRIEDIDENIDRMLAQGKSEPAEALRITRQGYQEARDTALVKQREAWDSLKAVVDGQPDPNKTEQEQAAEAEEDLGFWARHMEITKWMAAFGAAGVTIKFFDAITFDKAVEMTPVIQ